MAVLSVDGHMMELTGTFLQGNHGCSRKNYSFVNV